MTDSQGSEPKRTDVGYKRPPAEHQFKPGQKPPPRKKAPAKTRRVSDCLSAILAEERRVQRGRKVQWCTNGRLLLEVAFKLAEEGNATVSRALADYLIAGDPPEVARDEPRLLHDPDGETGIRTYTIRRRV